MGDLSSSKPEACRRSSHAEVSPVSVLEQAETSPHYFFRPAFRHVFILLCRYLTSVFVVLQPVMSGVAPMLFLEFVYFRGAGCVDPCRAEPHYALPL
jgi:hypothetical protein